MRFLLRRPFAVSLCMPFNSLAAMLLSASKVFYRQRCFIMEGNIRQQFNNGCKSRRNSL